MTYDLYVGANNWNNHHIGNNVKGIYSLKDADGKDYQLIRTETLDDSHYKQNQYPVTFRATYASEKIQIRNTIGFTHLDIPVYDQRGNLTYQPEVSKTILSTGAIQIATTLWPIKALSFSHCLNSFR